MNDTDSDVLAITQLVNLYGLAVDSQRWKMFDRIFTADVDADYGATSHRTDREQLKADVVHVDGDRAYSVCNGGWRLVRGGRRRRPPLGRHRLVCRHPYAHPRRLADHP